MGIFNLILSIVVPESKVSLISIVSNSELALFLLEPELISILACRNS